MTSGNKKNGKTAKKIVVHDPRVAGGSYVSTRHFGTKPKQSSSKLRGSLKNFVDADLNDLSQEVNGHPLMVQHRNPSGELGGWIASDVAVGKNVVIGPKARVTQGVIGDNVSITGTSDIKIDGRIGSNSNLVDVELKGKTNIGANVEMKDCYAKSSWIGDNSEAVNSDFEKANISNTFVNSSSITDSYAYDSSVQNGSVIEQGALLKHADVSNLFAKKSTIENALAHNYDVLFSKIKGDQIPNQGIYGTSVLGQNPNKRFVVEGGSEIVNSDLIDTTAVSSRVESTHAEGSTFGRVSAFGCDVVNSKAHGNLFEDVVLENRNVINKHVSLGLSGNISMLPASPKSQFQNL
jgi:hypothetical protein